MAEFRHREADLEFRCGLEELVRGHFDGCMGTGLSSSCAAGGGEEEEEGNTIEAEQLAARRRRRSDLDGDDLAESSSAARRHSRVFSRWVARQAEEMITTMERRNRESELMALAGRHPVSMLDPSFLRESRRSPSAVTAVERPVVSRASSMLQMWRELEDVTAAARAERRSTAAVSALRDRLPLEGRNELDGSSVTASESEYPGYAQWAHGHTDSSSRRGPVDEDDRGSSREQSPDLDDAVRERVRQIVRGWMTESEIAESASRIARSNETPRAHGLGELERERVRLVREWVQMTSQQPRESRASRREERQRERNESVTDGHPELVRRELLGLRGRQARLELITRMASERQNELQALSEHHAVSGFAHRNRIQVLLRGRFLRNGVMTDDQERSPSIAERELGQLRQHHHVSGLREGIYFQLENSVHDEATSQPYSSANESFSVTDQFLASTGTYLSSINTEEATQSSEDININQTVEREEMLGLESNHHVETHDIQETPADVAEQQEDTGHDRVGWESNDVVTIVDWPEETRGTLEDMDFNANWQENMDQDWPLETTGYDIGEDSPLHEAHEEWHEDEPPNTAENWQDEQEDPATNRRSSPIRRVNRFIPPDDERVYSMELRELLSRRSVSNLLHSGFRESLDQLIQSYVQRQGTTPFDWDIGRPLPIITPEEDGAERRDGQTRATMRSNVFPPPRLPSRPPLWHSRTHMNNWVRRNMHRSEIVRHLPSIEWDAFSDLKAEIVRMQQGMNNMQRMLEACMEMQVELQRAVRQEVSAALNRSYGKGCSEEALIDGFKWNQVGKGICCVCCDNHIDSLLYRCGHMCTCSMCAHELVKAGSKCPLCRAPIVEVIRAYSIN
ncbi:hypothetical protein ZIOFF_068426 [Zingiber officinale]|uniref:RING-type domain-containing protein n=1 Tax=Zingiber officinale TaxID=94328 RepID=A0A8J5CGU4_ZINOF|nr:hypothetical protein ZIOFF_068426 [Zingiber officinale]